MPRARAMTTRRMEALAFPLLALLLLALNVGAADGSKSRQAAILARVLSYELTLDARAQDSVGLAIVYKAGDAASETNAQQWYAAAQELSAIRIKGKPFFVIKVPYSTAAITHAIDNAGADVVLVADGLAAETPAIAEITRQQGVLSASNDPSHVQKDLTVCVTEQDGKPKIIINLSAADRESIRFSSNLLRLATIVR